MQCFEQWMVDVDPWYTHTQASSRVRVCMYSYPLVQCPILADRELVYKDAPREQHSTVMGSMFTWLHNYIQGFILSLAFSVNFPGSLMYSLCSNLQNLHGNEGKTLSYHFKLWNFCSVTGICHSCQLFTPSGNMQENSYWVQPTTNELSTYSYPTAHSYPPLPYL
jgi:hypothetical protein